MQLIANTAEGITTLNLHGKLDSFTSNRLQEELLGLLVEGARKFIVDFSQVDYISSAGIRVFYVAAQRLEEISGQMVFCALPAHVKKIFDIVDMSSEFKIFATPGEAFRHLREEGS